MTGRVSKLQLVDGGTSVNLTEDALMQRIQTFVHENLLDLEGDYEADVVLDQPRSDERKLGNLSSFERKAFALTALLEQRLNDILVDVEASSTEQITRVMRERKIGFMQATQIYMQEARMPDEQRREINMCAMTHTNLATLYDWSVRQRFNEWKAFLIVRHGFVVYSYW